VRNPDLVPMDLDELVLAVGVNRSRGGHAQPGRAGVSGPQQIQLFNHKAGFAVDSRYFLVETNCR
jgi:hypothetical protein